MSRIPLKTQIFYGVGVSYAIVDQIFAQWILYFYLPPENSGLKPFLAPVLISLALAISRVVDMVSDPVVGYLSDKFNSRWGRRIPFIAVGAIPLSLSTIAFFYPPKGDETTTFMYLALIGSLFFVFYTIVGAPYNALIPEIGENSSERLNLSTWQSVFRLLYSAIAMIFPGILIKYFGGGDVLTGVRGMVIFLSLLSAVGLFVTVFLVPEKKYSRPVEEVGNIKVILKEIIRDKSFRNYLLGMLFFFVGFNSLRAMMNYYVEDVMGYGKGTITVVSALLFGASALFFYPVNKASRKYGYRKIMLASLIMLIVLTLALFLLGKIIPVKYGFVIFTLLGIPISGAAFIFPPAMMSDISDKISSRTGNRIEGVCFGIQGFFLKMAFLVSIVILPLMLVLGGSGEVTKFGIYSSAIFSAVSFVISYIFYFKYEE
ncbi:MFS transporter [Cetobacterium sp.]|uniref:MFS transporter n=1 Tax=Cetobacterium sp. TaxID=2071632 RepID=UPI002FC9E67E